MRLGALVPNFYANSTFGPLQFYDWLGKDWCVLFSHPADFTPVCTTELSRIAECADEFTRRRVHLLGHSCDSLEAHFTWIKDIRSYSRSVPVQFPYPIISDESRELALRLDMIDEDHMFDQNAHTVRALYIIGPDRKVKMATFYPHTIGRNVTEILRVIDALQLTEKKKVLTPVDWQLGDDVLVRPDVPEDYLPQMFPAGVEKVKMPSGMAYVRTTRDYSHAGECWDGLFM